MECTNYVDLSSKYRYTPAVQSWGGKPSRVEELDISKDPEIAEMMRDTGDLPGVPSIIEGNPNADHLKFHPIGKELAEKLLSPIRGSCQDVQIGDWIYHFCIGKSVSHEHHTDKKENYVIGKAQLESEMDKLNLVRNPSLTTLKDFVGESSVT